MARAYTVREVDAEPWFGGQRERVLATIAERERAEEIARVALALVEAGARESRARYDLAIEHVESRLRKSGSVSLL